ncbi:MAG: anion permease [Bacteroidetes bacterium]|nr:MAG: anion permease [Bacteroidota bacterium]
MFGLDTGFTILLLVCLLAACAFEFINGFHDTANAVATVIYTHSLKPWAAVVWSGIWNFIGVNVGGIAVAIGIINLLPLEALVDHNLWHNLAIILALILTAIVWNLATWYMGIPCSSSHTLIGSIFGVGLAYILLPGNAAVSLNWNKIIDVGLALLISPLIGFYLAFLLMLLLKAIVKKKKEIFKEPKKKKPPPLWIRSILILTCTSVSYAHGSNDGQKGVGLIMLILIGFAPTFFTLNQKEKPGDLLQDAKAVQWTMKKIDKATLSLENQINYTITCAYLDTLITTVKPVSSFDKLSQESHLKVRKEILFIAKKSSSVIKEVGNLKKPPLNQVQLTALNHNIKRMRGTTEYAPRWVILMVSLALGLGTMVGWKRIVVTIGERIGKTHLTYAQGASAELVAASTIGLSSMFGLPVSTTHVLSSGVAGAMIVGKGKKNLQRRTIRSLLIAWIITVPVTIMIAGSLYMLFRLFWV